MIKASILALLGATTVYAQRSGGRVWIPRNKVNKRNGQPEEGDYRIGACKLHRPKKYATPVNQESFSGTVFAEQQYTGGNW